MSSGFGSLALSPSLLAVLAELGYVEMTPIQARGIPLLLAGRDLIGQAQTGSGKTAAFALPILERLSMDRRGPSAVVLCPTRELAAQVAREIRKLGRKHAGLHVLVLTGGQPLRSQLTALRRGAHIVVGTPGRVLDHLKRGSLTLRSVTTAVLDEADRMLDMGFQDDMERILAALPDSRQTAFLSATFPDSIGAMSARYQRDAVRITIDRAGPEPEEIRQLVLAVEQDSKLPALYRVLDEHPFESAIVFCHQKVTVKELTDTLTDQGVSAACLHGDLDQFDRTRVMAMFRNGSVRVLVATDVAARGIDVVDLDLVVNYDVPSKPDVYVHRIGRTGRAGRAGVAVSLATRREQYKLVAIEDRIQASLEQMPPNAADTAEGPSPDVARPAAMNTIHIAGGRKDKVRPGDILGALTGEAGGLDGSDIGKIEIHDRFAYVAVVASVARRAVASINSGQIKGRRFRASLVTLR